jgi:ceramide synthetase
MNLKNFDWEKVYLAIFLAVVANIPFRVNDLIDFTNFCTESKRCTPLGLSFLFYSCVAAGALYLIKTVVRKLSYESVLKNVRAKYVGKDRELRTLKVCKWAYDILYYTGMSVFACSTFYETSWFPFNRNFSITNTHSFEEWPEVITKPGSEHLLLYYIIQHGNHIYSLIDLIIVRRKDEVKFYEWLLHHFLAVNLIIFSAYTNFFIFGTILLMIHDFADIFVALFKAYSEMEFKKETIFYINVINMELVWFISRIYLFPTRCILPSFIQYREVDGPEWDLAQNCYRYMQAMIIVLFFMHNYWFGIMLMMTYDQLSKLVKTKQFQYHNDYDFNKELLDKQSRKDD